MYKTDPRMAQLIQASMRRAPSVQPSAPKIATSSTTLRTLSAPVAPTAIGRISSIVKMSPLRSSYGGTISLLPAGSPKTPLIQASITRAPSARPTMPAGASGFVPIPSALAAPLGGGGLATSSPGGLSGIGSDISNIGSGIMDTAKSYAPLAVKVVLAVVALKIVFWVIRGRRR